MLKVKTPRKEVSRASSKNVIQNWVIAVRYTPKNDNITPFESGGPTYDHHIYDLEEVGVENFKPTSSFTYDKKLAPLVVSKPFIAFLGEGFESVEELKHLKEVMLDLLRGEVVENLNLAGLDHAYVCTAVSSNRVFLTVLYEVGPSMDLVVRCHRLPNESLRKEAMKTAKDWPKKKVSADAILGKIGKIYIPDQKIGDMALPNKSKGVKRERCEAKMKNVNDDHTSKKQKEDSE
ncbi:hypothetical protein P3X46_004156 [Hevea brasiliensis]|uniref:Ribosome production factor 2 homolog n=1 Tax=Hevea brasiliensis TaxID=3981 RepID=A0ABQ9MWR3_HEVBR|nr:hypothetical protein P3X46_004156 [Hevea brasiliensis]